MNAAEAAKNAVKQLQEKLSRQASRLEEIATERKGLALAAEVVPVPTGNADTDAVAHAEHGNAKNRLHFLNAEKIKLNAESEATAMALAAARVNLTSPHLVEHDKAERQRAEKARDLAETFGKRGEAVDVALEALVREIRAIHDEAHELHELGFSRASVELIAANLARATIAKLSDTGLDLRAVHIVPSQRVTFAALVEGWAAGAKALAEQRLNKPKHTTNQRVAA